MIGAGVLFFLVMSAVPEREKLVVLEVTSGDESTKRTARLVEEQLLTELTRVQRFEVLGQNEIAAALGFERQRKLLGCTEDQGSWTAAWPSRLELLEVVRRQRYA
jgi:TolB-like protein